MKGELPIRTYASAGGVVVDSSGVRVLVLVRPRRTGPGGFAEVRLPKGHIEAGEGRRQAAMREVGEEAGISELVVLADLGHEVVEFDWKGRHYVRDESCYLMVLPDEARLGEPEKQFERLWLSWDEALARVTYEAERAWIRQAREAWVEWQGVG